MTAIADTLITPRLILRRPRATDLDVFVTYVASARSVHVGGPMDAAAAFDRFSRYIGHWVLRGYGRYVLERNGTPIGHTGPTHADATRPPEITWTLWSGAHEGQGLATEAARAVLHHLMIDCDWPRLDALILPENESSTRVAQRLGGRRTEEAPPAWYPTAVTWTFDAGALP